MPKMLERLESYKKLVEHENEAIQRNLRRISAETSEKKIDIGVRNMTAMLGIIGHFMPYVPTQRRKEVIDTATIVPCMKQTMQRLAEQAPDLSQTLIARYDAASLGSQRESGRKNS